MSTRLFGFIGILVAVAMLAVAFETADAARFGGGKSFGSKPSMSKPFSKPVPSAPSSTMRQQTSQQGAMAGAAAAPSRGLFGGMGGMLGGLLAGSLLGSMLFGGGFGGVGFMDLLLIAGLLFLAFKLFGRRRASSATAGYGASADPYQSDTSARDTTAYQSTSNPTPASSSPGRGGMDWGALASKPSATSAVSPEGTGAATMGGSLETPRVPENFDQEDFLQGAKAAYARLNAAWDKRDLDDIAQFATPTFMAELQEQQALDPNPTTTEIMLVNASLVEVDVVGDEQMASVYFTVLLREDPSQGAPAEVREVWHFVRPAAGNGSWKLDGIQQVE